ncbi:MAG TPA: MFS transporter [Bacillota bacterium]|jgi:DHA3 family macrolide efflux protein-like MFS transporter|nr:MFS transporter [Bacillota bacterium]HQL36460.1 MFS transporter [Bacillota bacterium]
MKAYKHINLVMFFSALLFSAFGYEFIFFIMTLHIYDLSKNALNVGIFTALTFIPRLFSSLMGGLADKLGKRKCLMFSAVMISILLLLMSYTADIRLIYTVWFIASIFLTFIVNVRGALMAEIVSQEKYTSGNAMVLSLLNAAKLLGPLLGGFIVSLYHTKPLIYFTCIVYLLVAVFSACISVTGKTAESRASFFDNAKRGFRFMFENRVFGLLASIAFFWRLFLGMQLSLFVIYIKSYLAGTSEQYGVFITVMGIGSIAGSLLGPYAAKRVDSMRLIAAGLGLHYASFAALGLCRNYYWTLVIIFASYMVFYMTLVGMHSVRDRITQFEIRSSAYGTVTAVLTPAAIISMLAGGYLSNRFGSAAVLSGAGLLALISLFIILYLGRNARISLKAVQNDKAVESV